MINKDTGKLVTNSSVDDGGDYWWINSTGEGTDNLAFTYLFFDSRYVLIYEVAYRPVSLAAAYPVDEIF